MTPKTKATHSHEQGTVILVALLALGLCVAVITPLLWPFQAQTQVLTTQRQLQQQQHLANAGITWAKTILQFDAQHSNTDTLQEPWAQGLPPTPLPDWPNTTIHGNILDANAQFNLNNLNPNDPQYLRWLNAFKRLAKSVGASQTEIEHIVRWLQYRHAKPPDNPIELPPWVSPSGEQSAKLLQWHDFKFQAGLSATTWQALARALLVLPTPTKINANTVSALVLHAVCPEQSLQDAQSVVLHRNRVPFRHLADFSAALGPKGCGALDLFGVQSDYFLVVGHIEHHSVNTQIQALLVRQNGKVNTLWVQ